MKTTVVNWVIGVCIIILFPTTVHSQENENSKRDTVITMDIDPFININWRCIGDLNIVKGEDYSVCIKGTKRNVKKVTVGVENGVLAIRTHARPEECELGVYVEITIPQKLQILTMNLSSDLSLSGKIDIERLKICSNDSEDINLSEVTLRTLDLSSLSSGDVRLNDIICDETYIQFTSSGDLCISGGKVGILKTDRSNKGDMRIKGIICGKLQCTDEGSGDVRINDLLCDSLSFDGQGSGDIILSGTTNSATIKWKGSGHLNHSGLIIKNK